MNLLQDIQACTPQASQGIKRTRQVLVENTKDHTIIIDEEIFISIIKVCLSNSQNLRMAMSAIVDNWQFDTDSKEIGAHRAETKQYATTMTDMRANLSNDLSMEKLDIPCVHGWNAILKIVISNMKPDEKEQAAKAIKRWTLGWEHIHHHIRICRVAKMRESKYKRLIIK